MKWMISYFEHSLKWENSFIQTLEIENKAQFFRFVKDLHKIANGEEIDEIKGFDGVEQEIKLNSKINIIIDYFNIDMNSKKNITESNKLIKLNIEELQYQELLKNYKKIQKTIVQILSRIELPIIINEDLDLDGLLKILNISINTNESLIHNLFSLIEVNKVLEKNKILIFINLKQYLNQEELIEFYKYATYNETFILLVDSQSYGTTLKYEKKLIIDSNLDEFLL